MAVQILEKLKRLRLRLIDGYLNVPDNQTMSISITFYGAAQGVTGSRHVLDVDGTKVLFDCGMFQGRRSESHERNSAFPIDPTTIHNMVLTHAHIDHSGALPILIREGFEGNIYCTRATADLAKIMLRDSGNIQERDAEHMNKKKRRHARKEGKKGPKELVKPIYTVADAEACDSFFFPVSYHQEFDVAPGIKVQLTDQGHIIGSASAHVTITRPGKDPVRIVFSGDLGRPDMPILKDPEPYPPCEYVLTESTYGNRLHEPIGDMESQLAEAVREVHRRGGRLIIPAFSVGRTQNIIYFLQSIFDRGDVKPITTYVDSPLSRRATHVYFDHPECFDEETLAFLKKEDSNRMSNFHYVESVDESKSLNDLPNPLIIISSSGMCEAGRILHHLKRTVEDPKNVICIVGYMAEHTLGRRIVDKAKDIRIFGQNYELNAGILTMNGFSAHADQAGIVHSISHLKDTLKKVILIHGEETQSIPLKAKLHEEGHANVEIAELFSTMVLEE
ncbi:MAG: metallo-beta-lactamase family protein [Planctomycetota bacterium]